MLTGRPPTMPAVPPDQSTGPGARAWGRRDSALRFHHGGWHGADFLHRPCAATRAARRGAGPRRAQVAAVSHGRRVRRASVPSAVGLSRGGTQCSQARYVVQRTRKGKRHDIAFARPPLPSTVPSRAWQRDAGPGLQLSAALTPRATQSCAAEMPSSPERQSRGDCLGALRHGRDALRADDRPATRRSGQCSSGFPLASARAASGPTPAGLRRTSSAQARPAPSPLLLLGQVLGESVLRAPPWCGMIGMKTHTT